jgi:hypothetical protein
MAKTTCRCKTGASKSRLNHSAQSSACFFSHEGQKEPAAGGEAPAQGEADYPARMASTGVRREARSAG